MNVLRFLACLPLVLSFAAHAQTPFQAGALVGLSAAMQSPGEDARTGFNVAVFVDYTPLPSVSASLEAAYVQKGQRYDGELTEPNDDGTVTVVEGGTFTIALDYLSLALAAKPSLPLGPPGAAVYAVAGPRLDVLFSEKFVFSGPTQSIRFSIDEHEETVWGYDVGLGLRFGTVLPVPLLAEVRFSGDLTDAFGGTSLRANATRNQVMQLRIGVEI